MRVVRALYVGLLVITSVIPTLLLGQNLPCRTYGEIGDDRAQGIIQTTDLGFIMAGFSTSFCQPGDTDLLVLKVDSLGMPILPAKVSTGPFPEKAHSIVRTLDGGCAITGWTRSIGPGTPTSANIFVIRLSPSMTPIWGFAYSPPLAVTNERAFSIIQTADQGYAVAGYGTYPDATRRYVLVMKLDINGTFQWLRYYTHTNFDTLNQAYSICEVLSDPLVRYAVVGKLEHNAGPPGMPADGFIMRLDAFGNPVAKGTMVTTISQYVDECRSVVWDTALYSKGSLVVAGLSGSFGMGQPRTNLMVAKFPVDTGAPYWSHAYNWYSGQDLDDGALGDKSLIVHRTRAAGYCVAGFTNTRGPGSPNPNFLLTRLGEYGQHFWTRIHPSIPGADTEQAYGIVQNLSGYYTAAGFTKSFGLGQADFHLVTVDSAGNRPVCVLRDSLTPGAAVWRIETLTVFAETALAYPMPLRDVNYRSVAACDSARHDVGVTKILAPWGLYPLTNGPLTPVCGLCNYGNQTESGYPITMTIGTLTFTGTAPSHAPGTTVYVTLTPDWTLSTAGSYPVKCYTDLTGDVDRSNDTLKDTTFIDTRWAPGNARWYWNKDFHNGGRDTAYDFVVVFREPNVQLNWHLDGLWTGFSYHGLITPFSTYDHHFKNFQTWQANGHTYVRWWNPNVPIPPCNIVHVGLGGTDAVTPTVIDWYWTDRNGRRIPRSVVRNLGWHGRNVSGNNFRVVLPNVITPLDSAGGVIQDSWAVPTPVRVSNLRYVLTSEAIPLYDLTSFNRRLNDSLLQPYSPDTARVAPGDSVALTFPNAQPGQYAIVSWANLAPSVAGSDSTVARDWAVFTVPGASSETGWVRLADMPAGPKNKNVKDGGCLAAFTSGDSDYVYALKGNNRCEFYRYNRATNTWTALESIPILGSTGKKKAVKKGASGAKLISSGIHCGCEWMVTKGNNTLEFWEYTPGGTPYPWQEKASIPAGARNVKEGSGMTFAILGDTGFVYFLKGSGTQEFHRYNTVGNVWTPMANAPLGPSNKPYKNGSAICIPTNPYTRAIYALKGSYNEFYAYDCSTNTWTAKASLPLIGSGGRKKKAKDGAGLAGNAGKVFCLKGGNTREFYSYDIATDVWTQLEDMPTGGGKNVKGGGALTHAFSLTDQSTGNLYALKGNNTLEFYDYPVTDFLTAANQPFSNAMSNSTLAPRSSPLVIAPNPLTNATTISYSLAEPGNVCLKLYDVTGTLVSTLVEGHQTSGSHSISVHQRSSAVHLAAGIYILKLETDNTTTTAKLIIE